MLWPGIHALASSSHLIGRAVYCVVFLIKVGLGTWAAVTGELGQDSDIQPLEEGSGS